jgi:hypothetical protein
MKAVIDERREYLGSTAHVYRIVKGKDVVVTVPPSAFGFQHVVKPVFIDDDGKVTMRTNTPVPEESELVELFVKYRGSAGTEEEDDSAADEKTKYDRSISRVPRILRDHMPDFYLKPLMSAKGIKLGTDIESSDNTDLTEKGSESAEEEEQPLPSKTTVIQFSEEKKKKKKKPFFRLFSRRGQIDAVATTERKNGSVPCTMGHF